MAAISVLDRDNQPIGPFTPEQIREKLKSGELSLDDLAYMEGLEDWMSLRQVLSRMGGRTRPQVAPSASFQANVSSTRSLPCAGFWMRYLAHLLDGMILWIPILMVELTLLVFSTPPVLTATSPIPDQDMTNQFLEQTGGLAIETKLGVAVLLLIIHWLYFAVQESSRAQATIGKRVFSLKVTNMKGDRIGFVRASGRFFGKILSTMIIYIGYLMAGFTPRRQALHDLMARTVVIRE